MELVVCFVLEMFILTAVSVIVDMKCESSGKEVSPWAFCSWFFLVVMSVLCGMVIWAQLLSATFRSEGYVEAFALIILGIGTYRMFAYVIRLMLRGVFKGSN